MKIKGIFWVLGVFCLANIAMAQTIPHVTIVANSIDLGLASGYLETLHMADISTDTIPAQEFSEHKDDSIIFIFGGHKAPDGIGKIVSALLSEDEKTYLESRWDAKRVFVLPGVWAEGQTVAIFAGHEKEQTRQLLAESQGDVIRMLKFNDNAVLEKGNITSELVSVPQIDSTQPFTEVDAYQAHTIIETMPDVIVVDVRAPAIYAVGHIPGAINIPERDVPDELDSLDPDKTYLLYCGGNSQSISAGRMMSEGGYENIYRLVDGYVAWRKAGYPRERDIVYT